MFSKFKNKKAPLSLNLVSNVVKLMGTGDLSPQTINSKTISVSTAFQFGLPKESILAIAHDPVQSLLAVSTTNNEIRVFGQLTVEVVFTLSSAAPITKLHFVKGPYLVALAEKSGNITVFSLHSKKILSTYTVGNITSSDSNYSLDWLLLGLQNGQSVIYDVDRLSLSPFKIDNLQKVQFQKIKLSSVTSILFNPRDIGTVLISYSHCAIIFSLITNTIKSTLVYQLDKSAKGFESSNHIITGGKKKLFNSPKDIIPQIIKTQWHPNGLHVATLHEDGTIVFFEAASGTILDARNLFVTGLHKPGPPIDPITNPFSPITDIRWVCSEDPEITQLIVSGGDINKSNALTVLDFGYTLKYSLTSNEKQGEFYAKPAAGQRRIEFNFNASTTDNFEKEFITKITPISASELCYFNGNHNPQSLLLQSNFNSLYIVAYSTTNSEIPDIGELILPPSLAMVLPPISYQHVELLTRIEWYSIVSSSQSSPVKPSLLLKGGAGSNQSGAPKPIGADHEGRTVIVTGHEGGLVRLVDITKGDIRAAESIVKINLKRVLFDYGNPLTLTIKFVSVSFENREMLVALANGEVVVCTFGKKKSPSRGKDLSKVDYLNSFTQHSVDDARLIDLADRVEHLSVSATTFLPSSLLQLDESENITAIKMSNIGFAAIAYDTGRLIVCDITRGPGIVLNCKNIKEFLVSVSGNCYVTSMEFTIMEYENESHSSIMLVVGTNCGGNLITFKILPTAYGGYEVKFGNKTVGLNHRILSKDDPEKSRIDQIITIDSLRGRSTKSNLDSFKKLSQGLRVPGYTIIASSRDIRVLQLPKGKLAHKVVDETCLRCGVVNIKNEGVALAILTRSGFIKFCSLPSLKDIADVKIPKDIFNIIENALTSGIAADSEILLSGSAFIRTGFSEFINLTIYDTELNKHSKNDATDLLFNENAIIPPRPIPSAMLWAKGQAHYIALADLENLICGPNRSPAKHPESQLAYNLSPEANPGQAYGSTRNVGGPLEAKKDYKEPVRRGGQQGPNVNYAAKGFMGNLQRGFDYVEESFNGYANQVSETVGETVASSKKDFYTTALKSKVGL